MFSFLNPLFLFFLPLSALPLLIHFLNRRRSQTILFSSLVFLKGLEKTRLRKVQLKQWLLLVIRTLVILLSVLAFARPSWHPQGRTGGGRASAVLVFDDGYRSGQLTKDGEVWERYKAAGEEVFALLKSGDEALVRFASVPDDRSNLSHDLATEEEKLFKKEVVPAGSPAFPLLLSAGWLASAARNLNRELYFFSDGRFSLGTGEPSGVPTPLSRARGTLFWLRPQLEESDNRALTGYRLADPVLAAGLPVRVEAEVLNQKKSPASGVLVSLFLDGKKVGQQSLDLSSDESKKVLLEGTVFSPGWHEGRLELPDDDLPADNRLYFSFYVRPKLRLLLASDSPDYWNAAQLVLETGGKGGGWFDIQKSRLVELSRMDWSNFDAVFVALPERFDYGWWERILRFVGNGGGALLAPEKGLSTYPAGVIDQAAGLRFEGLASAAGPSFFSFRPEASHPIFSFLEQGKPAPSLKFFSYNKNRPDREVSVAARFAEGEAALVERQLEKGRLIFSTAALDRGNTDLYFHAFAVPFFFRTAQYLASQSAALPDFKTGEPVLFAPPAFPEKFPLQLTGPDGSKTEVAISRQHEGYLDLGILSQPGIYRLYQDTLLVGVAAVNVDTKSSALHPVSAEQLARALPGFKVVEIPLGDKVEPVVRQSRTGRELWKVLAFAVLGLLGLEMTVVRWGESPGPAVPA